MSLTLEDVARIALLSRIELSPAERETTREQLNGILGFIEQLQAVDTTGIEPMAHAVDVVQRLRPDVVTETDRRADFQAVAPETEAGLYLVPEGRRMSDLINPRCASFRRAGSKKGFRRRTGDPVPRPHRQPQSRPQRLHRPRPRQDPGPGARSRRRAGCRRGRHAADRHPLGAQGYFLHQGLAHQLRLEDAGQLRLALRRPRGRALAAAGMVTLGKLNMDEFAMGSSNETSFSAR
jgi:aspartyl-tRNA(Asn)/glutamyl-tRNA(Gln) amidotransferase subunit C